MDPVAREAFAQWTLAQPAVSAFVQAMVPDRAERDDVLQEVAMAVLESFGSYDRSRPFVPWAIGIARHVAADSLWQRRWNRGVVQGIGEDLLYRPVGVAQFMALGRAVGAPESRMRAVADALVGAGVNQTALSVDWKGESQPAVATGDGVKEPLNRRATIDIGF